MSAEVHLLLRTLHLLGVIVWIGGTATAALTVAFAAEGSRGRVAAAARRVLLLVAVPGLLVAWGAGLVVFASGWPEIYARAGWMHAKLAVALVVTGLTGILTGWLRKAAVAGADQKPGPLRGAALGILALAAAALVLVRFQPF